MKEILKNIENDLYNLEGCVKRSGEDYFESLSLNIEELKNNLCESNFITQWFESLYVSDYDKKLAKEYINKLKP
jgi:hypothetical protein